MTLRHVNFIRFYITLHYGSVYVFVLYVGSPKTVLSWKWKVLLSKTQLGTRV